MGRARKPTGLHLVNGNPGHRPLNQSEPEPEFLMDLAPPAHLSDRSAAVWRELAPMLRSIKVLTVADVIALEMLCDSVSDYRHARTELGLDFVKATRNGYMLSQWLVAKQMARKGAEGLMAKFGMDPASRSKIMVDPQGDLFGAAGAPSPAATGTDRFFTQR
jgi:P27 family predicted phage terminase small subunit